VNLDPAAALATLPGPSPDVVQARAALSAQLAGLAHAIARLEHIAGLVPTGQSGAEWRGAAQCAYRAGVADLARELVEATEAVRAARRDTSHALGGLASRG
jgi:hypothetical protein